jgi:hypothetical protein
MNTNLRTVGVLGAAVVSIFAVACGAPDGSEEAQGDQTSALNGGEGLRSVDVTVSARKTGENYEARAYPIDDVDGDGRTEYYNAPVYYVYVDGVNAAGKRERREWKAPRFMPYNNPAGAQHDPDYKTVGFVTSGLSNVPRFAVGSYKPDYEIHNTFSPFGGAIVVKGTFYIHAGPESLKESGWGSAGCVEIIGNFDRFKKDILELAGSPAAQGDAKALNNGIGQLVAARKLFVTYESAARPNLRAALSRQVSDGEEHARRGDQPGDPTEPIL